MAPGGSNYRHQGVQQDASSSPSRYSTNPQSGVEAPRPQQHDEREEEESDERARRNLWGGGGKPQENGNEKSLASYGSWAAAAASSQAFSNIPTASDSNSKRLMSPYGNYDMDDSSFFAHTTRLSIVGPSSNSSQMLRRRSSSTERLLINGGQQQQQQQRSMSTSTTTQDFNKERSSCSLSPPPPAVIIKPTLFIPEKRTLPTESYLKVSLQPSVPLEDPTTSRKLLVLDLNGTLLLRSAHSGRRAPPPPPPSYSRARHSDASPTRPSRPAPSAPHPYPALRTIYPRPYLPSFCAYLFHPTTLQWLDTMVWSSAQPHSVNDMVGKCFGRYRDELKAVWARDTLGLSSDEYYKKTQTTKDLTKPWAQISSSSLISNPNHIQFPSHPHSTPENPNSEVETPDGNIRTSLSRQPPPRQRHSALTTVLMDDSPLKAVLQPWNHLCVSEYGSERRKLDVEIAERDLELMWLAERERGANEMSSSETTTEEEKGTGGGAAAATTMKSSEELENDKEAERKRKRKEKRLLKKEKKKLLLAKEEREKEEVGRRYDETLLAVIGILDRLKHEGNVAGWMRSGGLLHVGDQEEETVLESNIIDGPPSPSNVEISETTVQTSTSRRTTMTIPIPSPPTTFPTTTTTTATPSSTPSTPSTKRDGSFISNTIRGPSKRRRLLAEDSSDTEMDRMGERRRGLVKEEEEKVESDSDSDSEMVMNAVRRRRRKSATLLSSPLASAQLEQALTGVPLVSSTAATAIPTSSRKEEESTTQSQSQQQQPLLWYETPSTLSHWAELGRKALTELEIEIVTGVVPPNQNGHSSVVDGQNSMGVRL